MSRLVFPLMFALAVGSSSCSSSEQKSESEPVPLPSGWTRAALPKHPRTAHAATVLADGRVMVSGGGGVGTKGCTDRVELYDPGSDSWSEGPPAPTHRQIHASIRLKDDRVLLVGGWDCTVGEESASSEYLKTADLFDPSSGTWTKAGAAPHGMPAPSPALLDDGRVITPTSFNVVIWDPIKMEFAPAMGGGTNEFAGATATKLASGDVLVAGGGAAVEPHSRAYLWQPTAGTSGELLPPMIERRSFHRAIALDDGRALLAGGRSTSRADAREPEVYDPKTRTWTALPVSMTLRGRYVSFTRLPDGRVLALPSLGDVGQIFAPSSNTWLSIAVPANEGFAGHTATLLPNGKVLVLADRVALLYSPP